MKKKSLFQKQMFATGMGCPVDDPWSNYGGSCSNKSLASVTSRVVSKSDNMPLPGANIYLQSDPTKGVATNQEGIFNMDAIPSNGKIVISYIGFKPMVIDSTSVPAVIYLEEDIQTLDDVIVTATKPDNLKKLGWIALGTLVVFALARKKDKKKEVKAKV
ncbi:carboxypeptidase-like regulatory domain-containing protein [Abyssalbus ytuae]|uniref:Carboxypeptidase-like regulatory domain-containing protein n=1 Tax=Abyssalbus ytuae TaxID=2926907 RepID=A0A9E6ZXC2_9FLAO|nr:carboxypeptidase-like regulatory domain-containing protein [Abyssalbus ytuae]UOB18586.1 carboxypeptidase-like regulatory domain-containing protein [Abyssalbus ytuae]